MNDFWNWWLYSLTVTDRTNIVCFILLMIISAVCILVHMKISSPGIRIISIIWILFMDFLGIQLLRVRLTVDPQFLNWPWW